MPLITRKTPILGELASVLVGALALPASASDVPTCRRIDNQPPVRGMDGKTHRASCSGYPGTDPKFSFFARRTESKNLVVYFEGGGALGQPDLHRPDRRSAGCGAAVLRAPGATGQRAWQQRRRHLQHDQPRQPGARLEHGLHPVLHGRHSHRLGREDLHHVGHPVLPVPPGAPITIQHCGFDNFRVVMDWGKRNFDDPKKVLVTGVSAGGYGATANSPWVWRAFPRAQMYLRAHTSQGVSIAAVDNDDPGCKSWNPQLALWAPKVFGRIAAFAPGCQLLRQAAQGQPKAKVAQFTTTFDDMQIRFYG